MYIYERAWQVATTTTPAELAAGIYISPSTSSPTIAGITPSSSSTSSTSPGRRQHQQSPRRFNHSQCCYVLLQDPTHTTLLESIGPYFHSQVFPYYFPPPTSRVRVRACKGVACLPGTGPYISIIFILFSFLFVLYKRAI